MSGGAKARGDASGAQTRAPVADLAAGDRWSSVPKIIGHRRRLCRPRQDLFGGSQGRRNRRFVSRFGRATPWHRQ
jgi:hypothetical protein